MSTSAAPDGRIHLPLFEGPLDLLLYLIRKNELDIHDIPIVEITGQYEAMLTQLRTHGLLDLDFAGDYFLMAATLIQIKTRMLLPRPVVVDGEEPLEDPRADLVRQLLEYERYKEAAMLLREKGDLATTLHVRPEEAIRHLHDGEASLEVDLIVLARAFRKVLDDRRLRLPHVLPASRYTVRERMQHALTRLASSPTGALAFHALFEEGTVEEAVVTFLALLELVKRGAVRVVQRQPLEEIRLELVPVEERPDDDALAPSEFDAVKVIDDGEVAAPEDDIDPDAAPEAVPDPEDE